MENFPHLCMIFPILVYDFFHATSKRKRKISICVIVYGTIESMEEKLNFRMRYLRLFFTLYMLQIWN